MRLGACGSELVIGSATTVRFLPSFRSVFGKAAAAVLDLSILCRAWIVTDCDQFPLSQYEVLANKSRRYIALSDHDVKHHDY
jgi:hypothetical protein